MDNISSNVENGGGGSSPSGGGVESNGVVVRARSPLLHSQTQVHYTTLIVRKDDRGFGMKVSGDNPVFVQSVKDGGAAERAGLHSGDTIIKVNGVNVFRSKHTEVVEMIKASNQVVLTVQQSPLRERSSSLAHSPSLHHRSPSTTHLLTSSTLNSQNTSSQNRDRITAPLPVDDETQRMIDHNKVYHLRLMLEDEERNIERLRSQLAKSDQPDPDVLKELARSERTVLTLNNRISALLPHNQGGGDVPPPLPSRNITTRAPMPVPGSPTRVPSSPGSPPRPMPTTPCPSTPPPLPPRQYLESRLQQQLSSPSPPVSPAVLPHNHQRTKSSPENLSPGKLAEVTAKRLISSESMSELNFAKKSKGGLAWEFDALSPRITPPGTPPPPYPSPPVNNHQVANHTSPADLTDNSPMKGTLNHSLTTNIAQHSIISMEDEDMSDQELSQLENHGPFKSIKKLWNHQAHLAVFLKYVISNSDPSSLLFYLVTDLYKEGNIKEMKKWAYEIHSSFLVPGAPLRLNNVDENVAREIDDVLLKESDKEEILRRVFWKARAKAKEELNAQLEDFQSKRTSGLNTLFGPADSVLNECIHDKSKEVKVIESILLPVLEPYLEDIEKDVVDDRRFSTGAALGTVMAKVFGVRGANFMALIDRVPTYVSKDKSLKAKFMGRSKKQVTVRGHHCVAHQYYTVTYCNHCQLIIWGIGPQGYQCTNCNLNIHRTCVKILEENCPGPMVKKEKGNDRISKFMERIRPENTRRKPSNLNLAQVEKTKRLLEEEASSSALNESESGERSTVGGGGSGTTKGEKRPDTLREESSRTRDIQPLENSSPDRVPPTHDISTTNTHTHGITKNKSNPAAINRSESYKERIHPKRVHRERRKTSDPNLSKTNKRTSSYVAPTIATEHGRRSTLGGRIGWTSYVRPLSMGDVDLESQALSYVENSGSSSNSSLSTRSLESPSNSVEAVSSSVGGQAGPVLDSDIEAEPDPPDWTKAVPESQFKILTRHEKERQEVINELFHTERTHVRGLKVLDQVFHRPMREEQILPTESFQLLFANLEEVLEIHSTFNSLMKNKRKEGPVIGDISPVLQCMFEGAESENFQRAAAEFCARQHIALECLKGWRKKDPKLHSFLSDAEANPACRRLLLKDIISTGWQRLTKYPLLLENLARHTREESEDYAAVQRAIERSREILNHVDRAVKEAEDQHRLAELQRRIDRAPFDKSDHPIALEFRNLDLTKHRLIHEGGLNWRIGGRPKLIDLHVVLLEDIIILLQKQDEKYILKFYSSSLSPVIKVSTVLVRPNAVEQNGLFLVNTSHNGAQIYELLASSIAEKQKWFKHISEAAEAYKQKPKRNEGRTTEAPQSDTQEQTNSSAPPKSKTDDSTEIGDNSEERSDVDTPSINEQPSTPEPLAKPNLDGGRRVEESQLKISIEPPLIDPCEVHISNNDRVHLAEAVLTPLGKLKRKDETIRQALAEKQALVADMLNVPREDFETIADMAGEPALDKDPSELLLASVNQVNQLTRIMNEALDIGEQEVVGGGAKNVENPASRLPSVPAYKLQPITSSLIAYLTQLLIIMPEKEEERERLRRELQVCREQLHALHEKKDFKPSCEVVICAEEEPPIALPLPPPPQSPVSSPDQAHSPEVFVDAMSGDSEGVLCEQPLE